MNVSKLLEIEVNDRFQSKLEDYLNDHSSDLPLEDLCHRGGYPEVNSIEVSDLTRDGRTASCTVTVDFSEVRNTSCADVDVNDDCGCSFNVDIDEDGNIELGEMNELWDGEEDAECEFDDIYVEEED
jgi:hypothetical protein